MIEPVTSIPINWNTIIMALITMVGGVTTAYLMKVNNKVAVVDKTTKEIHTAVNTNYQRMVDMLAKSNEQMEAMNERFLRMQDSNVVMRENARSQEISDARYQGQAQGREQTRRANDTAPAPAQQAQEVHISAPVVNVSADPPAVTEVNILDSSKK